MERIKFIIDSTSDILDEDLQEYDIQLMHVPITVDGVGYLERKDFTSQEFYPILANAKELPTTSQILPAHFLQAYKQAFDAGYTDVICTTMNSKGSSTFHSAELAAKMLAEEYPETEGKLRVHVVDSRAYSAVYGYSVPQAAKLARQGASVAELLEYLRDYVSRAEIYIGMYSLKFSKRSGRISAASAIVGEALGIRPIVDLIDGKSHTLVKMRGEKQMVERMAEVFQKRYLPGTDYMVAKTTREKEAEELIERFTKIAGRPPVMTFYLGASVSINTGPETLAFIIMGEKRP